MIDNTLVFLDTETTGLADTCEVWEIGMIVRKPGDADVEYCWRIRPDLTTAEPTGLRIGRYYERIGVLAATPVGTALTVIDADGVGLLPEALHVTAWRLTATIASYLDNATLVGAVPDFDARHLTRFLRANGQAPTWHYHLVDVETLAAGSLRLPPRWNLDQLLAEYGLKYDEADRHTALGDARMVRDLYDAVMAPRTVGADAARGEPS
jgi:DNA polymerase III alpha subunit (gram-positive type)